MNRLASASASFRFHRLDRSPIVLGLGVALGALVLGLPSGSRAALREYRMRFEPSPSANAAGYTLHIGRSTRAYEVEFDLADPPASGGTILYALDLEDSVDLFVTLQAYDVRGLRSAFSNELRVSAVIEPTPEPAPEPVPTPTPTPTPVPEPEPAPEPEPTPGEPGAGDRRLLFFDDFEQEVRGGDPEHWLDTGPRNALTEAPETFFVTDGPSGGQVFATDSAANNVHSHYVTPQSVTWWDYEYAGRMQMDDARAGIGVTLLSDYPNSDSYLRVRRFEKRRDFHLAPHGAAGEESCVGQTSTGFEPRPGQWVRFRFRAVDEAGATRVLFRAWDERDGEPANWQIDCLWSGWEEPAGAAGLWSMGPGLKKWDDLGAWALDGGEVGDPEPPAESQRLYSQDFDALAIGEDPPGWLDTGSRNSFEEAPGLFVVGETPDGGRALASASKLTNIHSHQMGSSGDSASGWRNYEYSGRMRHEADGAGLGVTLYSDYPDTDRYLRLRRDRGQPEFHVSSHPDGDFACAGSVTTKVVSQPGRWYRFRVRAFEEGDSIRLQGRVWDASQAEADSWQVDCRMPADRLPPSGAPGVWAMGGGLKYWDDLVVRSVDPATP